MLAYTKVVWMKKSPFLANQNPYPQGIVDIHIISVCGYNYIRTLSDAK